MNLQLTTISTLSYKFRFSYVGFSPVAIQLILHLSMFSIFKSISTLILFYPHNLLIMNNGEINLIFFKKKICDKNLPSMSRQEISEVFPFKFMLIKMMYIKFTLQK